MLNEQQVIEVEKELHDIVSNNLVLKTKLGKHGNHPKPIWYIPEYIEISQELYDKYLQHPDVIEMFEADAKVNGEIKKGIDDGVVDISFKGIGLKIKTNGSESENKA